MATSSSVFKTRQSLDGVDRSRNSLTERCSTAPLFAQRRRRPDVSRPDVSRKRPHKRSLMLESLDAVSTMDLAVARNRLLRQSMGMNADGLSKRQQAREGRAEAEREARSLARESMRDLSLFNPELSMEGVVLSPLPAVHHNDILLPSARTMSLSLPEEHPEHPNVLERSQLVKSVAGRNSFFEQVGPSHPTHRVCTPHNGRSPDDCREHSSMHTRRRWWTRTSARTPSRTPGLAGWSGSSTLRQTLPRATASWRSASTDRSGRCRCCSPPRCAPNPSGHLPAALPCHHAVPSCRAVLSGQREGGSSLSC